MIGIYNQFDPSIYITRLQGPQPLITTPNECGYVLDTEPIGDSKTRNSEPIVYNLINSNKDRITQINNLIDKIKKFSQKEEDVESDTSEKNHTAVRYFSDVNSFDVACKGVCRRCKKPGHYEKWCTEEKVDQTLCKYCLGTDHYHLRCPNNLCYKCNQYGHMAKDCRQEGLKCHRCNKRGHKSKQCFVINLNDDDIFDMDRQQLKLLKCLNCMQIGHLNCCKYYHGSTNDKLYNEGREHAYHKLAKIDNEYERNHQSQEYREIKHKVKQDDRYEKIKISKEIQKKQQNKQEYKQLRQYENKTQNIQKRKNSDQSVFSVWSEQSPDAKRKFKLKQQKQKQKNNRQNNNNNNIYHQKYKG